MSDVSLLAQGFVSLASHNARPYVERRPDNTAAPGGA